MRERTRERLSITFAKKPGRVILIALLIINVVFILLSALLIVLCYPDRMVQDGFWVTAYKITTMILDAGCITSIIEAPSAKEAILAIMCLSIIVIGMVTFTGAAIGYITNVISGIFESAKSGSRRLHLSEHMVLINWNSRACEIINDLLYSENDEKVVVLVSEDSEAVEQEIDNRIADTIERDIKAAQEKADKLIEQGKLSRYEKKRYIKEHTSHAKVTVIVRQGETYSLKQLNDISILQAKTVIILSKDERRQTCKYELKSKIERSEKGNTNTIKNLIQVAQLTASAESRDDQKIVVEVEDEWTLSLVEKVIKQKENEQKCKIVPILVNRVLGQILSQFSIMPELNTVYSELFSNSGLTFYSKEIKNVQDDNAFIGQFMKSHDKALPITIMDIEDKKEFYYIAAKAADIEKKATFSFSDLDIELRKEYRFEKKHIAILGHNSKSIDVMKGFMAFIHEWDSYYELVDLLIIDDKEHLEKVNYYKEFQPYISMNIVEADVFDKEIIIEQLSNYIDSNFEDTSILILSDDHVNDEEIDANSLTFLIYVQDIISEKRAQFKAGKLERFHSDSIDVVVELINPKNYDVARSYSADNVIISNRYISKMIVQLGDKEEIYSFYRDILTYDESGAEDGEFESKELYVKVAERFLANDTVFPFYTTPAELVQQIFDKSPENNKSILIGMSHHGNNKMFLDDIYEEIKIAEDDKLILFSPH